MQDLGGATALKKLAAVPAPDATKNVAWLKLGAVATGAADGSTRVKEVYRVRTVGGVPPATCEGVQGGALTVEYAAIYHFYASAA